MTSTGSRIRRRLRGILALQIAGIFWGVCIAQTVVTNLDLLQKMMGETAAEVRHRLPLSGEEGGTVSVLPADVGWALDRDAVRAFLPAPSAGDSTGVHAVFGVRDVQITYDEAERDGLFGEKTVKRTVRMIVAARVTRQGSLLFAEDLPRQNTDRIPVNAIATVDHPTLAIARGTVESEGVFQGMAEPLILIGAIGIAVFLLFHVRS
jgi:hypothetical protein